MDHSIVFSGRLRDGSTLEEVRANFGRLFRLEPGPRLDSLFSGQPVTLKKGLSEEEARRYADALLRAGAHCEVVRPRLQAQAPVMPSPAPLAVARASAAPAPAASPGGLSLLPMDKPAEPEPAPAQGAMAAPAATSAGPATGVRLAGAASAAGTASPYAVGSAALKREPAFETNSSGGGANAYVPDEVRGLSWGGFLMNWIWGLFNGTFIALATLLPFVGFFVCIYLLFKGRELAWRNRRWDSIEHFNRVQRRWGQAGLVFVLLSTWWIISTLNQGMEEIRAARNGPPPTAAEAEREQVLSRIEDPATREQMRRFYAEMDRVKAARQP